MVQLEPLPKDVPQVLDWPKSLAFAPVTETPIPVRVEPLLLVSVTV